MEPTTRQRVLDTRQLDLFDQLAALTRDPDSSFDRLRDTYLTTASLIVADTVHNALLDHPEPARGPRPLIRTKARPLARNPSTADRCTMPTEPGSTQLLIARPDSTALHVRKAAPMESPQFTTEPLSDGTVEPDISVSDVVGHRSRSSPLDRESLMFDVIIAGCGPTGAMLATELRLHDVRVLVLEKEAEPESFVRIVGLHIRSIELMAMRGLLDRIREHARQRPAGGFFAAINTPAPQNLNSAHAYLLGIPQSVVVHLLEEHATHLGAQVRRGCAVTDFEQDDEGVTIELAGGEELRSRYLVGCDGGRSTVRKLLGVEFPGEASRNETLMGEMEVGVPPEEIATAAVEIRETHQRFWLSTATALMAVRSRVVGSG